MKMRLKKATAGTIHAAMKRIFQVVSALALLVCTAASCGPPRSAMSGPRCAFADPACTTSMGICYLVAEYYVEQREWPVSKAQLEEQLRRLLEKESARTSAEVALELSAFLDRFTLLDFGQHGENLVIHYRFKIDRKTIDQTVMFKPRSTANEIIEAVATTALSVGKPLAF